MIKAVREGKRIILEFGSEEDAGKFLRGYEFGQQDESLKDLAAEFVRKVETLPEYQNFMGVSDEHGKK